MKRGPKRPKPEKEKSEKEKRSGSQSRPKENQKTGKDAKSSAPKKKSQQSRQSQQSQSTPAKVPKDRPVQDVPEGYPMQSRTPEAASPSDDARIEPGSPARPEATLPTASGSGSVYIFNEDHPPSTADVGPDLGPRVTDDPLTVCVADDADPPDPQERKSSKSSKATNEGSDSLVEQLALPEEAEPATGSVHEPIGSTSDFDTMLADDLDRPALQLCAEGTPEDVQPSGPTRSNGSDVSDDEREPSDHASDDVEVAAECDAECDFDPSSSRQQTTSVQEDIADVAQKCPAASNSRASTPDASPGNWPVSPSREALDGRTSPVDPVAEAETTETSARMISHPSPPDAASPDVREKAAKAKTPRPRKPPLPHDALRDARAQTKSTVARSNELDYLGLDPALVEKGEIRNYQESFGSFVDVFSWSQSNSDAAQKERYLREALQIFTCLSSCTPEVIQVALSNPCLGFNRIYYDIL